MAKGNKIIVSSQPRGVFETVIIDGTPKPGTCMTMKATAVDGNGHFEFEVFNADAADGENFAVAVLDMDALQGRLATTAYADGELAQVYYPVAGEQLNVLKKDVAGTGDDFLVGSTLIIDDGTGKVILTTGSPEREPFQCLEAITDPTADQLVWVKYTGC